MDFTRYLHFARRLLANVRGNVLVTAGLALPIVVGGAGIGIHSVQLVLTKRQLQREADSAALAGAYSLFQAQGNTAATAAANDALTQNNLMANVSSTITPGPYTAATATFTSSMYVRLTTTKATPFMSLFGMGASSVAAEARAAVVPEGKFCYLALETGNVTGVTFQGNTSVNLGCGVGTNSTSGSAAIASGSSSVTASPIAAMGGVPASTNYAQGTVLMPNHAQIADPFGSGTTLDPSSSDVSNSACKNGNAWRTISVPSGTTTTSAQLMAASGGSIGGPGCYGTISVQGNLILDPGTYYLANGANNAGLQIGSQAVLTCNGCTFVLTSTTPNNGSSHATMSINGGAQVNISAATTGTYAGIVMYRDRRASASNQCCMVNGNSSSSFSGAFYFPADTLTFAGTAGMAVNCIQLVSRRITFTGDSDITNTCTPPGGGPKWSLDTVRLVS